MNDSFPSAHARRERRIAIACQGGGSHAVYDAGVVLELLEQLHQQPYPHRLVGLSGTSGGAFCALLAWWGLLEGSRSQDGGLDLRDTRAACRALKSFWQDNSAQTLPEHLHSALTGMGMKQTDWFGLPQSPYNWSHVILAGLLQTWAGRVSDSLPASRDPWLRDLLAIRPEFLNLEQLIRRQVDFTLLGRLMKVLELANDSRTLGQERPVTDLGQLLDFLQSPQDGYPLEDCRRGLVEALEETLQALQAHPGRFQGLEALLKQTRQAVAAAATADQLVAAGDPLGQLPVLYLGSTDVQSGDFKTFSSARGEIDLAAVLASAAIPKVFKAVRVRDKADREEDQAGHLHWDGLFSQNPPVLNFISEAHMTGKRPDEIWIAQVNARHRRDEPRQLSAIKDRRNELTGNLSLHHEVDAILADNQRLVQELVDQEELPRLLQGEASFEPVNLYRIAMDKGRVQRFLDRPVEHVSKFARTPAFLDTLRNHGREQARLFALARRFMTEVLDSFDPAARQAALAELFDAESPWQAIEEQIADLRARLGLSPPYGEDLTLGWENDLAVVEVRWRAYGLAGERTPLTVLGQVRLEVRNGYIRAAQLQVQRVRILQPRPDSGPFSDRRDIKATQQSLA